MATISTSKSTAAIDAAARATLIEDLIEHFEDAGLPCDRITDFATLAVQVGDRILTVKVTAPKLVDKDGEKLFDLDEAILAYEDRVRKEQDKAAAKAEKERKSAERKAEIEARKAAKAAKSDK